MPKMRYYKTKPEVKVTFEYERPDASTVALACEEQGWAPIPMRRSRGGERPWTVKVRLPRDRRIQYRFVIDGDTWVNDPNADALIPTRLAGRTQSSTPTDRGPPTCGRREAAGAAPSRPERGKRRPW